MIIPMNIQTIKILQQEGLIYNVVSDPPTPMWTHGLKLEPVELSFSYSYSTLIQHFASYLHIFMQ